MDVRAEWLGEPISIVVGEPGAKRTEVTGTLMAIRHSLDSEGTRRTRLDIETGGQTLSVLLPPG